MCDYISFATYNVKGLQNKTKRKKVFTLLKDHNIDIALLQETHCTQKVAHLWEAEWGGKIYGSHGESDAKGVLILFQKNLPFEVKHIYKDVLGRAIIVEIQIQSACFLLVNIYAPNADEPDFYINIAKEIESFDNRNIVWGGDFNLVLDVLLDRYNSKINNKKSLSVLDAYMQEADLHDVWRVYNPEEKMFTFFCSNPLAMSRIDLFLVSGSMLTSVWSSTMVATPVSDHSMV